MNKKTLLVLTAVYPDKDDTLLGDPFVKDIVDKLHTKFERVIIISVLPYVPSFLFKFEHFKTNVNYIKKPTDYQYENIEVYYPTFMHLPLTSFRKRIVSKQTKVILKLLNKHNINPDLVHAHFLFHCGAVGVELKRKLNIPLIVTGHGCDVLSYPNESEQSLNMIKHVVKNADQVCCVSSYLARKLKNLTGEQPISIPNGYESGTPYKILTVGNLIDIKNHETLIYGCEKLRLMGYDFKLYIIGEGPLEAKLKKLVSACYLDKHVQFVGYVPHEDISVWMQGVDVLVHPSLDEGGPMVLYEALSVGTPYIGYEVGLVEDVIKQAKNGLIVHQPFNKDVWASAMITSIETDWNKEYIKRSVKGFSMTNTAKRYYKEYKEMM